MKLIWVYQSSTSYDTVSCYQTQDQHQGQDQDRDRSNRASRTDTGSKIIFHTYQLDRVLQKEQELYNQLWKPLEKNKNESKNMEMDIYSSQNQSADPPSSAAIYGTFHKS